MLERLDDERVGDGRVGGPVSLGRRRRDLPLGLLEGEGPTMSEMSEDECQDRQGMWMTERIRGS